MSSSGPGSAHACRVCGADVPAGAARCPRCNAAQNAEECPHCGAQAGTSRHPEFRFVCDICGAPRVPKLDKSIAWSGRELASLQKAEAARKGRAGWRAAGIASGLLFAFTIFVFLVLALIFGLSLALALVALFVDAPLVAFMLFSYRQVQAKSRAINPALDAAWLAVGHDVAAAADGPLTTHELASKLGIEEAQAEELLALIDVDASIGGGGGARARMRVAPVPETRARVAPTPEDLAAEEMAEFDQELENRRKKL